MAENNKTTEVTRLTQDKSLGEKMKLVAGFYAKKVGRAVDNSTPFQMAREVRDSWREFKGDVRDMGQAVGQEWQQGKKRVRVGAKLARRNVNNRLNAFGNAIRNSAPVQSAIEFKNDMVSLGNAIGDGVRDGVDWVRKAPGRAVGWAGRQVKAAGSWMGNKIKAAGSWLGNKIKSGAKKSWDWLKNTKAAKAVVKTTKAVTKAAVKTAMVVATPAILTYKGAKAVYDGGKNTYNKAKNWFNDKAELAARLETVQNKPNEQVQEAAVENVHSDAVNENQTQKQTEQQKKTEEIVAEAVRQGDTRTAETAEHQNQSQTEPNQAEASGRERSNPLNEIDPLKMAKIEGERQKLEDKLEGMKKSGRPVDDKGLFGAFAQQLTSKDKNGFGLTAAQAEAYKQQYPDRFPKPEEQKKIDEATKKTEKSASQQAKQVENSAQPTAHPKVSEDVLIKKLEGMDKADKESGKNVDVKDTRVGQYLAAKREYLAAKSSLGDSSPKTVQKLNAFKKNIGKIGEEDSELAAAFRETLGRTGVVKEFAGGKSKSTGKFAQQNNEQSMVYNKVLDNNGRND